MKTRVLKKFWSHFGNCYVSEGKKLGWTFGAS